MADQIVKTRVPHAHVQTVIDTCNAAGGKNLELSVYSDTMNGNYGFVIDPKDDAETVRDYVERCSVDLLKALCKLRGEIVGRDSYNAAVQAIGPIVNDVQDDVVGADV